MDRREAARRVKELAIEAGFDLAGIATAGAAATGEAFLRWLARGDHAGMSYLERSRERRLDPREILPAARSVVCVAWRYAPLEEAAAQGDLWPHVARYARGIDYHDAIGGRLERLGAAIASEFPGSSSRPYVDTGPVLEREWATRAGLGAFGKNTNLLHPAAGSWLLLGELLSTLDLEPDIPVADLCGSCTRCLDACPTNALPEAFRLDSRRCISYWTIEHRGAIPEAVRPTLGEWVFGCDICQEVCPWNVRPSPVLRTELALSQERREIDLEGLLGMTRARYESAFRGSPMKRAKLEGLQRNAAVAMGNRREARYVPALARALAEGEETVRGHAAWALGEIGGAGARSALSRAGAAESSEDVRREIRRALARVESASAAV